MNSHLVPDRAVPRNSRPRDLPSRITVAESALPGSLGDLVARSEGRPIYCTPAPGVRRALMAAVVGSFCRDFPSVEFVNALDVSRPRNYLRWRAERDRYGAGIVVTSTHTKSASRLAEVAGEHVIGIYASIEIESLALVSADQSRGMRSNSRTTIGSLASRLSLLTRYRPPVMRASSRSTTQSPSVP